MDATKTTEREIFEALDGPITAFARRVSVRPDQQDDYAQEGRMGIVLAFRAYQATKDGMDLRKLCLTAGMNRIRSLQRKLIPAEAAIAPEAIFEERGDGPRPSDRVADDEKADEALRLAGVEWDAAEIVKEHLAYPGFRMEDLAEALSVSRATVSRLLSRTRENLVRLGRLEVEEKEEGLKFVVL